MKDGQTHLPIIQETNALGPEPIFKKIGIVGLGLIGGSIALASRAKWPEGLVIGVDKKEVLEMAMLRHAIDVAADDLMVLAEADLIILAAPVKQNIGLLKTIEEFVPGEVVITDVGSTKREIVERARRLPGRFTYIGGHPLGGAPRGGLANARSDLFMERPWLLTPIDKKIEELIKRLSSFVEGLGAKTHIISPSEHDRLLAFLSHLPQLTASALMHVVGNAAGGEGLKLTGRGLADTTRLASSPASIWKDICASNADEIGVALDVLIDKLREIRLGLDEPKVIEELFGSASEWKQRLGASIKKK
tara:strand:+ start:16565 stop:17479 length:915 start_codon:yes stop_codon:yes gene_type:complete